MNLRLCTNNSSMKAIIMAGGEGTRLRRVTGELPKPMVPLLGKPLMERIIDLLRRSGITEICATLQYHPQPIMDYFGNGERLGVSLSYALETTPLGTAGGVKNCGDFCGDEDVLVISGDAACDFDLRALTEAHRDSGAAATLALYESADPLAYGLVVPDRRGDVCCFLEKPDWQRVVTNLVNTGIYVLSPRAMAAVPRGEPFDFARQLFPLLLEQGERLHTRVMEGYWCDIGSPRAYYRCCLDALDGKLRLPDEPEPEPPARSCAPPCPLPGNRRVFRRVPCRDRAKLMRAVTEAMLELGAELGDGLVLRGERCGVRICPDPGESELLVEAHSFDREFSRSLAVTAAELARALEQHNQS